MRPPVANRQDKEVILCAIGKFYKLSVNKMKPNAILLLTCPDQKGIVASVSNFIFHHSGNIVHAAQHTTERSKIFFMRIEWELDGFDIPRGKILEAFEKKEKDKADFWLEVNGRFILISYQAIYGARGEYLGTLEMSMDATEIRGLQGQRRLLDW